MPSTFRCASGLLFLVHFTFEIGILSFSAAELFLRRQPEESQQALHELGERAGDDCPEPSYVHVYAMSRDFSTRPSSLAETRASSQPPALLQREQIERQVRAQRRTI
jgi:hypothetical protein